MYLVPGTSVLQYLVELRQKQGLQGPFIVWDMSAWAAFIFIAALVIGLIFWMIRSGKTKKNNKL